jgi:arylformamidase
VLTHSNHLGTHLDGEIHFYTAGKDIAELSMDFLVHDAAIVDLSDIVADYDIYTAEMVESKVEVHEGDILIIHTGFHHFGWVMPTANEIRNMVQHPGPDREFALWAKQKRLRWIGVDCGSADHPMNTIIREWMPRQTRQAEAHFRRRYGGGLADVFDDTKYQLMHIEMFPEGIIHAECIGGEIDLLMNQRVQVGFFPWRFVDGESSIGRCVAFVDDVRYDELMVKRAQLPKTKYGDAYDPSHVEALNRQIEARS